MLDEENLAEGVNKYSKSNYTSMKAIGEGSFGEVVLATRISDGRKIAIKKVNKKDQMFQKIGMLPKEFVIMKDLHHHGVAKVLDLEEDSTYFYIIMKYYEGGDIHEWLEEYDTGAPARLVLHIARQLIDAVGYCHDRNVVHRDIKLENLLWEGKRSNPHVVLTDFGVASIRPIDQLEYDYPGSPVYAAPELMEAKPYLGVKSDVWAIGVCLYFLFTGEYPFWAASSKEMIRQITKDSVLFHKKPSDDDCRNLIKWMLTKDPEQRPTIAEIQQHPCYIQKYLDPGEKTTHVRWEDEVDDDYIEIETIEYRDKPSEKKTRRRKRELTFE